MKTTLACTAGIQTDCTDSDNFIINLCIQILHFFFISYILANHLAFCKIVPFFFTFFPQNSVQRPAFLPVTQDLYFDCCYKLNGIPVERFHSKTVYRNMYLK